VPLALTAERTAAEVRRGTAPQVRLTVSLDAVVQLRLQRRVAGRRARGRCVPPAAARRRAKRCTRWVTVATERRRLAAGTHALALRARPRALGRYRLRVRAGAGAETVLQTLAFRVVRRR
jgi:hypothetical protein